MKLIIMMIWMIGVWIVRVMIVVRLTIARNQRSPHILFTSLPTVFYAMKFLA